MRRFFLGVSAVGLLVATAIACTGGGGSLDGDPDAAATSSSSSGGSSGSSSSSSGVSDSGPKGPTDVKDNGFSHSCNTDQDCVPVYFGDACGFCNGSNAAIAQSSESAWQTAYNAARANCPPQNAAGECARLNTITRCDATKTCQLVSCGTVTPVDEHHCQEGGT